MRSTEVNARSEEVFGNQYAMPGGDGSYVNANMGYGPAEEEKGVNERRAPANMNLLTIGKLCGLLGIDASEGEFSLFKKQDISVAAQRHGNLIVPDIARETTLGTDSVVAVVPIEQNDSLTPLYAKKHLFVELGLAIAASDEYVEDYEIVQLSYALEKHFSFTNLEIRALTALKDYCLLYPPDMETTARLLAAQMPMEERLEASRMMTTVAAAGGQLARMEFDTLGALFDIMGLGDDAFNQVIDELHLKRVWILLKNG